MLKNIFPAVLFLFILNSCNFFNTYEIVIDNPTQDELLVEIGKDSHIIQPYGFKTLKIKAGDYEVKVLLNDNHDHFHDEEEGEEAHNHESEFVIFEGKLTVNSDGIFNPALYTYVIWKDLYVEHPEDFAKYAETELNIKPQITINDKKYNDVDFEIINNQSFIAKKWDYGLFELWSDNVDVYSKIFEIKSKIYRLEDLEEEWGYWGEFDMSDYSAEDFQSLIDSLEAKAKALSGEK